MRHTQIALVATLLAGGVGAAAAQGVAVYDPNQLPAVQGKVAEYSLTPRGDVDGVILEDGTQVHVPPRLGAQLVQAVKPGDTVTIHGLKAQSIPVIQALSIAGERSGQRVADAGRAAAPPRPSAAATQWMSVQGRVREPLYGPRGDMNGALLEDGTQIHLPPPQAQAMSATLQAGQMLVAEGYGVAGPYGRALGAQQIGGSAAQLVQVGPPRPPHGHGRGPGAGGGPRDGAGAGPGAPPPPAAQDAPR